ncbi:hypothetical protein ACFSHQ_27865 [Gemmobacter lanyuensis]
MSASSRLPPALRLRQILTRVPGRILRRMKRGLTRSDPRLEAYLAALESPVDPGLVLWQGHGAGLVQDWATRPQEGGQTHVLALERPDLLSAPRHPDPAPRQRRSRPRDGPGGDDPHRPALAPLGAAAGGPAADLPGRR